MFSSIIKKILKQSLLLLLLQNVLKKVANGVSEISSSHELELATRMEVLAGIITELEKVFTVLTVSIPYVAINFFLVRILLILRLTDQPWTQLVFLSLYTKKCDK